MGTWRAVVLPVGLLFALVCSPIGGMQAEPPDWVLDVPDGAHFYTQGSEGPADTGYVVSNVDGAPFLETYEGLGGPEAIGYPISHRFSNGGATVQGFERLILRSGAGSRVQPVEPLDAMHDAGLDDLLYHERGVPLQSYWVDDATDSPSDVERRHLDLLAESPVIRAVYFAEPDAVRRNGLPMAPVQQIGDVAVLRAQRAVFRQWPSEPGAEAGIVTIEPGGVLAREFGFLPAAAVAPMPSDLAPLSALGTGPPTPIAPTPIPSATAQPVLPTATPRGCAGDEELVFFPVNPMPDQVVHVSVTSAVKHASVVLDGAFIPTYLGVYPGGKGWFWSWLVRAGSPGQYGYEVSIDGETCTGAVLRVGWGEPPVLAPPPLVPPATD